MNDKAKESVRFKGTVVRNVHQSEHFSVYAMDVDLVQYPYMKVNLYKNVSICGELPILIPGVEYDVVATEGKSKNGVSYRVSNIHRNDPLTQDGVRAFLEEITSHNLAYVISSAYPDIIERVKENRLDDIDLSKMHGVGKKNFAKIVQLITENFYLSDLTAEFGGVLSFKMLRRIYAEYGSVDMLKDKLYKEPYTTLTNVSGIGFKTADAKISAMQDEGIIDFGYDVKTSVNRCLACIMYLLKENENEGHTKMRLIDLCKQVSDMTPECEDKFRIALTDDAIYYNIDTMDVSLRKTHDAEEFIAKTIIDNLDNDNVWQCNIEKYRRLGEIELSDEQLSIVDNVCNHAITILNGSAGSGKSQSTKAIINMLEDQGNLYKLFAPTGKAAKVLSEFTKRHASTIHRGLGYRPSEGWAFDENHKLMADIVIVDEMSMVDVWLFWHLLKAIDFSHTKLLMIGDNSQLPSVGCGNLLHDFMMSDIIPTVTLTQIFRYGEGGLMKVATDIRKGKSYLNNSMKGKATFFGPDKDYTFIDVPQEKIPMNVVAMYKKLLENGNSVNDIQVITAKNVGKYGTIKMNEMLQRVANKNYGSDNFFNHGGTVYYIDDLVIECSNNYNAPLSPDYMSPEELYDAGEFGSDDWPTAFVANGESGIIRAIGKNSIDIDFDGIIVRYDRDMADMIKLGYAITCHKSQGASINNVIFATPQADIYMLNSNLLYVGCTRAREKCIHFGAVDTVNKIIKKKANLTRHTFMQQMLKDLSSM